ncbi:hypothetical protein [Actinoalloteichus fjordicus]|uniref:PPE family domain-containing protein n=2 Tax=Actinoalloteichus TaxID=65496 RepID=A0AAC9PPP8_9PSEU|nr:hypothetical protein [Actinoalloteichus fjordicus]APU12290.1 hypothetical protein UA74_00985 [Actinoalloteichus fjordicus]
MVSYQPKSSHYSWDHTNAQAISAALKSDPDGADPGLMKSTWDHIADRFLAVGEYIESSMAVSRELYHGAASDQFRNSSSPLAVYAIEARDQAAQVAMAIQAQAAYQAVAKAIVPIGSPKPEKGFIDSITFGLNGHNDEVKKYDEENQRARDVMTHYQSSTNSTLVALRGFDPPVNTRVTIADPSLRRADDGMPSTFGDSSLPGGGTDGGGSGVPGGGSEGGSHGGSHGGGDYGGGSGGSGGRGDGPGYSAPPTIGPDFNSPGPVQPSPIGAPLGPPNAGPPPGYFGPPGGGPVPPSGFGAPHGPNGNGANPGGRGPGGVGGHGPGGPGGWPGGFGGLGGGPGGGRIPAGFGPGSGGGFGPGSGGPGGGFGPGGSSGGGRLPGGFGPAGGGAGGMGGGVAGGGGAGGRGGAGEEDKEHQRADYLIEMDDVFTDGTKVAPAVFGDEPPSGIR